MPIIKGGSFDSDTGTLDVVVEIDLRSWKEANEGAAPKLHRVRVYANVRELAREFGRKAVNNKTGRSVEAGGMVVVSRAS